MSQNRSHAVMAQRASAPDELDFFPTPLWATRALCEHVIDIRGATVWEPACGEGHMSRALAEYAGAVHSTDVYDYGFGDVQDFLEAETPGVDWIITNPPFALAERFVEQGLKFAGRGVAMLVRSVFIESIGRYERLFSRTPPSTMAQFTERVPMLKGRLDRKASSATSYCWLVWEDDGPPYATLRWIPPCRAQLERAGDYE